MIILSEQDKEWIWPILQDFLKDKRTEIDKIKINLSKILEEKKN